MSRKIAIFGATSAIAMQCAKCFAARNDELFLVARDKEKLSALKDDLLVRGAAKVETAIADLANYSTHQKVLEKAAKKLGEIDVALIAYGTLSDQKACESDFEKAEKEIQTNFVSVSALVSELANHFEARKAGTIAVISSVAGDRGRKSNYVYGTAKGALNIFLQGVRNRLHSSGVHVLSIKPGFVDTPMTASFKKGPLFASAERVGQGIVRAIDKRKDVVYLPWFWRWIMLVIKIIPECIFKRLSI